MKREVAESAIWGAEQPRRIEVFEQVMAELDDATYWELLRAIWCDSENLWQHRESWRALLTNTKRKGRGQHFMVDSERAALSAMPAEIAVWRGAGQTDPIGSGLSWTTDEEVARRFAARAASEGEVQVLLHGRVRKTRVLAYIAERDEREIVVPGANRCVDPVKTVMIHDGKEHERSWEELRTMQLVERTITESAEWKQERRKNVARTAHERSVSEDSR